MNKFIWKNNNNNNNKKQQQNDNNISIIPQLGLDVGGNFDIHIWAC